MVIVALTLSTILAVKKGLPIIKFYLATVLICLISFLGGRIFFEIRNFDLSVTFSDILLRSGTESTGVYIGGIIGAFLCLKLLKIDELIAFDIYAPILAISLIIGRFGCLMSGCCYGKVTSLPWGISFPYNSPAYLSQMASGTITSDLCCALPVHPTQVYEMIFGMVMLFVLLFSDRLKRVTGQRLFVFLAGYAVIRFFIEFLRADDRGFVLGLSYPQVFSLFSLTLSLSGIAYCNYKTYKKLKYFKQLQNQY
jgi:phosphatidylglycerol:prolipoprotein diacylglycerol transferase